LEQSVLGSVLEQTHEAPRVKSPHQWRGALGDSQCSVRLRPVALCAHCLQSLMFAASSACWHEHWLTASAGATGLRYLRQQGRQGGGAPWMGQG
jgi:hypothetical protein